MPGKQTKTSRSTICSVCHKKFGPDDRPWTEITLTGYTVAWHTGCDAEKQARRG